MSAADHRDLDVLIFGGGGAGLWLLDELNRAGFRTLLVESKALGSGQTVASQGIIHGGLKYTLGGLLTESARAIREMPDLWRACLTGQRQPDISGTQVLADYCHLWRTSSLKSRMGMVGARAGLRSVVRKVSAPDLPSPLVACPGEVFSINEQVIDTGGFVRALAERNIRNVVRVDPSDGVEFIASAPGRVDQVILTNPNVIHPLRLRPRHVVFTAGGGNADLCAGAGLSTDVMQRRPLHMVMVRGSLPALFGHCVDGAKTRVTITSAEDSRGRFVWQVGGQVSEDGVHMSPDHLVAHARAELGAVLPNIDLAEAEWATYRVDRAEGKTPTGVRPEGPIIRHEGNVITGWPTKLALVPELAKLTMDLLGVPSVPQSSGPTAPPDWPRPEVAPPPWETERDWVRAV